MKPQNWIHGIHLMNQIRKTKINWLNVLVWCVILPGIGFTFWYHIIKCLLECPPW